MYHATSRPHQSAANLASGRPKPTPSQLMEGTPAREPSVSVAAVTMAENRAPFQSHRSPHMVHASEDLKWHGTGQGCAEMHRNATLLQRIPLCLRSAADSVKRPTFTRCLVSCRGRRDLEIQSRRMRPLAGEKTVACWPCEAPQQDFLPAGSDSSNVTTEWSSPVALRAGQGLVPTRRAPASKNRNPVVRGPHTS